MSYLCMTSTDVLKYLENWKHSFLVHCPITETQTVISLSIPKVYLLSDRMEWMIKVNDYTCINFRSSLSVNIAEYKLQKETWFNAQFLTKRVDWDWRHFLLNDRWGLQTMWHKVFLFWNKNLKWIIPATWFFPFRVKNVNNEKTNCKSRFVLSVSGEYCFESRFIIFWACLLAVGKPSYLSGSLLMDFYKIRY